MVAAVALAAFVVLERRQRAPMLDLTLFRNRTYVGANLAILLVSLAMFGVFFFVSLFLQNILGYSAVEAGAAFLPMTILIIIVAPIAGRTGASPRPYPWAMPPFGAGTKPPSGVALPRR